MLLGYHKGWTKKVLDLSTLGEELKEVIGVGCTANDLCELTNQVSGFIQTREVSVTRAARAAAVTLSAPFESKDAFSSIRDSLLAPIAAFYQSHFGSLASLHAMAKKAQEPPETTRNEVMAWFAFFNGVALGSTVINPEAKVFDDQNDATLRALFSGCREIKYHHLFDSKKQAVIKGRAVGMMCHLIEDLLTASHCERNSSNEIVRFYNYNLQDMDKHRRGDHAMRGREQELARQCSLCVENTAKGLAYDCGPLLVLSRDAREADAGPFAPDPQTGSGILG